jgi:RND family efflux transporter MFP subunit
MTDMITLALLRGRAWAALLVLVATVACSDASGEGEAHTDEHGAEAAHTDEHGDEHGDEHSEGGAAGRVELTEAGARTAGIEVAPVQADGGPGALGGLEVPGQVEFDPARVALVSPRAAGRIERLAAVEGDRVGAGQPVAYVLSSAFLTAQNDFLQATRRAELLAGTQDEQGARALVTAARRRLQLLGATPALMARLQQTGEPMDLLPVPTPFAGSIVEMQALPGSAVEPGSPIFKIADLSVVNVTAEVPERALPNLRTGQAATIRLAAYPSLQFTGRVERIRDELNPETRTAQAVIRVANSERTLRPGMFASVSLPGLSGGQPAAAASASALTVPASAVVTDGAERYVFVEVGPRTYERREVQVGPASGDRVAVTAGLAAGDRVVTRGAFTLKSELGKAGFGGHAH